MKKCVSLLLILVFLLASSGCYAGTPSEPIRLVEENSHFSDFRVENDTVYISCELTLRSTSSETVNVRIHAFSEEDVKIGLLKDACLVGVSQTAKEEMFAVPAGETVVFHVDFLGEYGGTARKADRLLPDEIEIEAVR